MTHTPTELEISEILNPEPAPLPAKFVANQSLSRLIEHALTVDLIAEPLEIVPVSDSPQDVLNFLQRRGFDGCGVHHGDQVTHYTTQEAAAEAVNAGAAQITLLPIEAGRLLTDTTPILHALPRIVAQKFCLVMTRQGITHIVAPGDLQKQPVRLLLFSVISNLEMSMTAYIRARYPTGGWETNLKPKQVADAQWLLDQRTLLNQQRDLAECLQFKDKGEVCFKTPELHRVWQKRSPSESWHRNWNQADKFFGHLQRVRDVLAHSNDFKKDAGEWERSLKELAIAERLAETTFIQAQNVRGPQ